MTDNKDVELLLISIIQQKYELNQYVPNIQMLIFKMFCSPISTKTQRKSTSSDGKVVSLDVGENILLGNIFADKNMTLHPMIYKNLLDTLGMMPKKKYFKKIVEYIQKYENEKEVQPLMLDQIISLGI